VLSGSAANDPYNNVRIAAIVQALQQLGWTIGHNVRIDTRCPGPCRHGRGAVAAGDPHRTGCVPDRRRSGWRRLRRQPGAAGAATPPVS
jgi:hypothetical protein